MHCFPSLLSNINSISNCELWTVNQNCKLVVLLQPSPSQYSPSAVDGISMDTSLRFVLLWNAATDNLCISSSKVIKVWFTDGLKQRLVRLWVWSKRQYLSNTSHEGEIPWKKREEIILKVFANCDHQDLCWTSYLPHQACRSFPPVIHHTFRSPKMELCATDC